MTLSTLTILAVGCAPRDDLPGPPINMVQVVPGATDLPYDRAHGIVEIHLTPENPSHTFWNDPATAQDAWGTITLKSVRPDGTVSIDFSGRDLTARPGRVFPGTGVKVIASDPKTGTAHLRSRWTHTFVPKNI